MQLLLALLFFSQSNLTFIKVPISSKEDIKALRELGADITHVNRKAGYLEALFPKERLDELSSISYKIVRDYDEESIREGLINFGPYFTWDEVKDFVSQLKSNYPDLVRVDTIGYSWQGRELLAMRITAPVEGEKSTTLITGVHHAREPIGASIVLDVASRLCEGYGSDTLITWLLKHREVWLVPVVNPDGYAYNEVSDGYWRKNMRDNNEDGEFEEDYDGVDLNRNYGYMWGYDDYGSSPDPGNQIYRGPAPFSEPEVQAIRELADSIEPLIALNYHSYGNDLLFPWGYDEILTPEDTIFRALSEEMTKVNGYISGTGWEILYIANGDSDDWLYGEQEEKPRVFAFTPEVGEAFWQPDTTLIVQQLEENWPMNLIAIEASGLFTELVGVSAVNQNNDPPSPGDTVFLTVYLKNLSPIEKAQNASLTLRTEENGVEFIDSTSNIGTLLPLPSDPGDNAGDPFKLIISDNVGKSVLHFWLHVEANSGDFEINLPLTIWIGEPTLALEDDFESGLSGWETWGQGGPFELTESDYHSPSHSVTESPSGNYRNNWNLALVTAHAFDLSSAQAGSLIFWQKYSIEEGYDWANVEVTRDGEQWFTVAAFTGEQSEWHRTALDLSPYLPAPYFKVRFHFTSDAYVTEDGWYIDDVSLVFDTFRVNVREQARGVSKFRVDAYPTIIEDGGMISLSLLRSGEYKINLFDVSGRMVSGIFKGKLREGVHKIKIRNLPEGIYFLSVNNGNSHKVIKVLVKRPDRR